MTIAYFCCEYAVEDSLPQLYAGGLGVLAGDLVLEGREDMVFMGLGYGPKEKLKEAGFLEMRDMGDLWVLGKKYGGTTLFLLKDKGRVCEEIYGPDKETMIKQQMLLGMGGVRVLGELGIRPDVYHLNEGHTAFTIIGLISQIGQIGKIVATKHTIFSGAGLRLTKEEFQKYLGAEYEKFFEMGTHPSHPNEFSTTNFLLKTAQKASAVSQLHAKYEKIAHPESRLIPITNGISVARWDQGENHQENKIRLIRKIGEMGGDLDENILTVVWARRLVEYKRPLLIFDQFDQLDQLVNNEKYPVQIIIAGKVNPLDEAGSKIAEELKRFASMPQFKTRIIFWGSYDLEKTKLLTAGADVWLNTPMVGREACGTSGMKAGLNGALQVSTNDGWFAESGLDWVLDEGQTAESFYNLMEKEIVPMFYENKDGWAEKMRKTREVVAARFTTKRMLEEYREKLYS
ncbi:MAG: alpha-glucan family phosphorylase [Patescibacteria group bacterium]